MYLLKETHCVYILHNLSDGYFVKPYIVQGEKFYAFTWDINKAKKYKSKKNAEKACEKLNNLLYKLEVVEEETELKNEKRINTWGSVLNECS